jgi:hypothetical protein
MKPRKYGELPQRISNRLLASLPAPSRWWLNTLEPVKLKTGMVLNEPERSIEHVYFPDAALVSLISYFSGTSDGETIQVCVVGSDGVAGLGGLLSDSTAFHAVVQIPGRAYSMSRDVLIKEFKRCDVLHRSGSDPRRRSRAEVVHLPPTLPQAGRVS